MSLILLAGVWALAFGHISVTQSYRLKGNDARIFGAVLIAVAAFGMPHLNAFFGANMPSFIGSNDALKQAYDMLVGALAIYATGWIMTRVVPKVRVPRVTLTLKRSA
jgi:hypothetical protein